MEAGISTHSSDQDGRQAAVPDNRSESREDADVAILSVEMEPLLVQVKQEPVAPPCDNDDDLQPSEEDDDVICIDSESAVKYLKGEMSFKEYSALLDKQVKLEDDVQTETAPASGSVEPIATVTKPSQDTATSSKRQKRRSKLPRTLQGLMGEANMKFARGEIEEAIKMCMEIIRLAPNAAEPFQTLAMLYEETGEAKKAMQYSLIAAYLHPYDVEEWMRLAELSLEHEDVQQALTCYDKAVKADSANVAIWFTRCELLQRIGDDKRAIEGYQHIMSMLSAEEGEKYMALAKDITKHFHLHGELNKAMETMSSAFELHPKFVRAEDVNFLLELCISLNMYRKSLKVLVQHCGVKVCYADGSRLEANEDITLDDEQDLSVKAVRCIISEELPVDLHCKLVICMIHLNNQKCIPDLMKTLLFSEDPEDVGDLYLDVAEAHMEKGQYEQAAPLLSRLVRTQNYNLAAVWLRYGECLNFLSDLQGAVRAYKRVVDLAPGHSAAKVTLSNLQQQLGRHDEALETLQLVSESVTDTDDSIPKLDLRLLLPRCHLLYTQQKKTEFIECCKQILFGHYSSILTKTHLTVILSNRSLRHRVQQLKQLLGQRLEKRMRSAAAQMAEYNICVEDLWELYLKLCDMLVDLKQFAEFENVACLALIHNEFVCDPDKEAEVDFIALTACILNNNGHFSYSFIKELCIKGLNQSRAWNVFCYIITISEDIRHNRFCMRLLMKQPDHFALRMLNAHNAMVAGTYKFALGEYVGAYKQIADDPLLNLCIGITFIHMSCQKFASRRHALVVQGCAFLSQYISLRGECQESSYNVGRAMHQLGLYYAAIYHYEKALSLPPAVKGSEEALFDLRKEVAFNLTLIYQQSGSYDLANLLRQKYLVV